MLVSCIILAAVCNAIFDGRPRARGASGMLNPGSDFIGGSRRVELIRWTVAAVGSKWSESPKPKDVWDVSQSDARQRDLVDSWN